MELKSSLQNLFNLDAALVKQQSEDSLKMKQAVSQIESSVLFDSVQDHVELED